jgi:hypothetical protein
VRRSRAAAVALAAALLGPALGAGLAAAPASASNGTSSVGCSTGDSCTVMLQKMVSFTGRNYDRNGGGNTAVDITPPPCLWEPIGGAQQGSQYIIDQYGTGTPDMFEIPSSVATARTLVKTQTPGEWYELPANPNDDGAQLQACGAQPLFVWVPPDQAPPGLVIPPQTLAQLAIGVMRLPGAGQLIFDPAGTTYTNLPTFLQVTLDKRHYTGPDKMPYARVTATLANNAATVWAVPSKLQVSAAGGGQYTPDTTNCGYLGSKEMGTPAAQTAGPGTPIDCGLTFQSPATWQVTATMTWRACWAPVASDGPPPADCQPVPGAQLNGTVWHNQIVANEIQSIDSGTG